MSRSLYASTLLLFIIIVSYTVLAPGTKVEESLTTQAIHDILFLRSNISSYDHLSFPGPVPRTFLPSLTYATLSAPFVAVAQHFSVPKPYLILIPRLVQATIYTFSLLSLAKQVSLCFGVGTANLFLLISVSQFHLNFYSSRMLPNIPANILFNFALIYFLKEKLEISFSLLGIITFVLRSEALIISGFLYVFFILLYPKHRSNLVLITFSAALTSIIAITFSILIDSRFWLDVHYQNVLIWPEFGGFIFNAIQGKSIEWGTSPFHWYFTVAIPKLFSFWILILVFSPIFIRYFNPVLIRLFVSSILFIIFYSFNSHKEVRFIFYIVPVFNIVIARSFQLIVDLLFKSYTFINLRRIKIFTFSLFFFACFSLSLLCCYVSMLNYPGYKAIKSFNSKFSESEGKLYITNLATQTGVSRWNTFLRGIDYYKEEITEEDINQFQYLIIEVAEFKDLSEFRVVDTIFSFDGYSFIRQFPFFQIRLTPKLIIYERQNSF
ncbi:hypothetical protein P9112_007892 [Eukaryota sp. TZLM1-RC]